MKISFFVLPILIGLVAGVTPQASAHSTCEVLFQPRPLKEQNTNGIGAGATSDIRLWQMVRLFDLFQRSPRPKELPGGSFESALRQMESFAAGYLSAEEIRFMPIETSIPGPSGRTFQYLKYELIGTPSGKGLSRMIYEYQVNPRFNDYPLRFIFDPLFGSYELLAIQFEGAITLGPLALLSKRIFNRDFVRHELQHYFEHVKLMRGENTLGRILLNKGRTKSTDIYYQYFFADEIEAHAREKKFDHNNANHDVLDRALEVSGFFAAGKEVGVVGVENFVKQSRSLGRKFRSETFDFFVQQTLKSLEFAEREIVASQGFGAWGHGSRPYRFENSQMLFALPAEFEFAELRLDLTGGLVSSAPSDRELKSAALRMIQWSRERIRQIR